MIDTRLRTAIDSSVGWYGDLFTLHGVRSTLDRGLYASASAPPPLHSDAVVVEPGVTAEQVLDAVADRPHCGVKDSFATLDLSGGGLSGLFDASWIHLPAPKPTSAETPASAAWSRVTTPDDLAAWTALHDTSEVLLPGLLDLAHFAVLAKHVDGRIVAGAVARLASGVVDVSNTYAVPGHTLDWSELTAVVAARFPERPLVGYLQGVELEEAVDAGFSVVGPLRVWAR